MNSLLKDGPIEEAFSQNTFLAAFEIKLSQVSDLEDAERLMKKLQFLGLNFDPFQDDPGSECVNILNQLGLQGLTFNPYEATNIILRLLDITEERLKNLKQ